MTAAKPDAAVRLSRRGAVALLLAVNGLYFFSNFQRVAVPGTIFNELQSAFGLSAKGIAALGTLTFSIYGGMQLAAGLLADGLGASRVILAGGALLTLGSVAFALAPGTALLFAARALVGLGASVIYVCVVKEIEEVFGSRDFPFFLGISLFIGYSGGLSATLPFERIVSLAGWRAALLWAGVACGAALCVAAILLRRAGRAAARKPETPFPHLRTILRNRASAPVLASATINWVLYYLFSAIFGKKLLQDVCGLSSMAAASAAFAMNLVSTVLSLVFGASTRAIARRKPLMKTATIIQLTAASLMLVTVSRSPRPALLIAGMMMLSLASAINVVFSTTLKEINPAKAVGVTIGLANGLVYVSIALLSNLAGVVLDLFRSQAVVTPGAIIYPAAAYRTILAGCLALAAVSFTASCSIHEPRPVSERPGETPGT